jgi:hypothetical protein
VAAEAYKVDHFVQQCGTNIFTVLMFLDVNRYFSPGAVAEAYRLASGRI